MPLNHDIWVFDLDNTLYPASTNLFAHMDVKMGEYVARVAGVDAVTARTIQKRYFYDHGTTLAGLMANHAIDPDHFLDYVHDIDLTAVTPDPELVSAVAQLPGRKLVFTNADAVYGQRVLDRLGLGTAFEAIFDIRDAGYLPKPDIAAYHHFCSKHHVDAKAAIMVEDMARNLVPAKELGMATVWINNGSEQGGDVDWTATVDHEITALAPWLTHQLQGMN